ncbi:hypothetical protein NARC_60178 [Candidatus Nitrosocosmicus arcticus]|uniref:Uncharacterized protein n=1 Tax=Candidatus Nitrosocosmicus arcticus TaxID=2035267 RepID=A0A557SW28_9ARCH|nr:hypothetical protein NARC_60178 [Candidatus Nitrosocosmicus arcticus]
MFPNSMMSEPESPIYELTKNNIIIYFVNDFLYMPTSNVTLSRYFFYF